MNKLTIFLQQNKNAPYEVKKVVVDACFNSSLLYGCESWLGVKPTGTLNAMYMKAVKILGWFGHFLILSLISALVFGPLCPGSQKNGPPNPPSPSP